MISREEDTIAALTAQDNLRELLDTDCRGAMLAFGGRQYVNLSSNDYLGLSSESLQDEFMAEMPAGRFVMGNPASRLMTGNSPDYARLELSLSRLYNNREALVLGSGYLLNSGLPKTITRKGDLIVADKLVHASMIDGIRLAEARHIRYRHNDMSHLESILARNTPLYDRIIVMTESLFSMDGDKAPLAALAALQYKYGFHLYLDEAHAFGVYGSKGGGLAEEYNSSATIPLRVDYLVATLGKAVASQGAFVICDGETKQLLVNKMRTIIFSTALPPISLMWSDFIIRRLAGMGNRREHLQNLVDIMGAGSQIIPLMAGSNARALSMVALFREHGYWTTAIRHPTVPQGTARIRLSLTAALTEKQMTDFKALCDTIG